MTILQNAIVQQLMQLIPSLFGGGDFGVPVLTQGINFFEEDGRLRQSLLLLVKTAQNYSFQTHRAPSSATSKAGRSWNDSPGNAVDAPSGSMNVSMNYSGPTMAFDDKRLFPVEATPRHHQRRRQTRRVASVVFHAQ